MLAQRRQIAVHHRRRQVHRRLAQLAEAGIVGPRTALAAGRLRPGKRGADHAGPEPDAALQAHDEGPVRESPATVVVHRELATGAAAGTG